MKRFFLMLGTVLLLSVSSVYAQKANVKKSKEWVRETNTLLAKLRTTKDAFLDVTFDETSGTIHYCGGKKNVSDSTFNEIVAALSDQGAKEKLFTRHFFGTSKNSETLDDLLKTKANFILSYYKGGFGRYLEVPYTHEEMKNMKQKWQDNYVEVKKGEKIKRRKKKYEEYVTYPGANALLTDKISQYMDFFNSSTATNRYLWSYNADKNEVVAEIKDRASHTIMTAFSGDPSWGWRYLQGVLVNHNFPSKFFWLLDANHTGVVVKIRGREDGKAAQFPMGYDFLHKEFERMIAIVECFHERMLMGMLSDLNAGYPQDLGNGLCIEKVEMDNYNLVYNCAVDESRIPLTTIAQLKDKLKVQMAGSLKTQFAHPNFEALGKQVYGAHFGIQYHYYVKGKAETVDITYTNEEVEKLIPKGKSKQ